LGLKLCAFAPWREKMFKNQQCKIYLPLRRKDAEENKRKRKRLELV